LVLLVLFLVPPLASLARHYELFEALQFSVFALVIPALFVLGAPWWRLGLATLPGEDGPPRLLDRLATARRRHRDFVRGAGFVLFDLAVIIFWRTSVAVDHLVTYGWLSLVEAATLGAVGILLWLELVASPPLVPRCTRPERVALAAVSMWTVWTIAYFLGFSRSSWYQAFHHGASSALSGPADQQLSTVILWFVAAAVFVPVIFWNLVLWLRSEEDPDDELQRLVRESKRRGWYSPPPLHRPPR